MAWCKLEDTFFDDPKFFRLAKLLGVHVRHAQGLVAAVWSWAVRQAPDGDLRQFEVDEIEQMARWEGDHGAFVSACLAVQLLDEMEQGVVLHRFFERAESHRAALRQQKHRDRNTQRDRNVTVTSPATFRGEEREDREERRERKEPCDNSPDIGASFSADALALQKFYFENRKGPLRTALTLTEQDARDKILSAAGSLEAAKAVVKNFLADEREHYVKRKWALTLLEKDFSDHEGDKERSEGLPFFAHREKRNG